MRNGAFLKVVLLGLLTFALAPGLASAAGQGQDLTEMLASNAAASATAVSGPLITVSPLTLNFGIVDAGTTSELDIQICNTGDAFLNVFNVTFSDPAYSFPISAGGLSPGVCSVMGNLKVAFSPLDGLAHPATMTITSDASNGTQTVPLSGQGNTAPVLSAIGNQTVSAFSTLAFTVTANDLGDTVDDLLTFSMGPGLPPSATFNGGSGEFSWTPPAAEAGAYSVQFSVSDSRLSDSETISITVALTNSPPVANAGGTYFGATNRPLQLNGSGSSDPDGGQTLSFAWSFGDGTTGSGANPQHTYQVEGSFLVSLTVCDNGTPQLCATDVAAVTIQTEIAAQIILKNNGTILNAKKDNNGRLKMALEEVILPYTELVLASIRLSTTLPGAGSVSECPADPSFSKFSDLDLDGVTDFSIKFAKSCLHDLFEFTSNGAGATIVITGQFVSGSGSTPLRAERMVTVKTGNTGQNVSALAYPNPFNPETAISYTVKRSGPVTMRIYAVNGRLVRTLKDGEQTAAGTHEVRWNGADQQGRHMPSGVYFVKTSQKSGSSEETSTFKLAMTK